MKIKVLTDHPIAYESFDHIEPKGTMNDYNKNSAYTNELFEKFGPELKYLDLGCAGAGFVEDIEALGALGVGIDGSDYSLRHKRAAWADDKIPHRLFTADITQPFTIIDEETGERVLFDVISAFDVLEHIYAEDLPQLLKNVTDHLRPSGYFLAGIATFPDEGYHVTLAGEDWWADTFLNNGFKESDWVINNFGRVTSINWVVQKA